MEGAQPTYIAVHVLLRRSDGLVPTLLRTSTSWMPGYYCIPSGRVEPAESAQQAAIRELHEEVGVVARPEDVVHIHTAHRLSKYDDGTVFTMMDIYFLCEQWQGEPHNAEPDVHGSLVWQDPENFTVQMLPYQKDALAAWAQGATYSESF